MNALSPGEKVLAFVFVGVIAVGLAFRLYLSGRQAGGPGDESVFQPAPLPPKAGDEPYLKVHVSGAVRNPGVYVFRADERVADAIARAGGPRDDARLDDLNLAAHLRDGIKITVPSTAQRETEVIVVTEDIYVREPPAPRPPGSRTTVVGPVAPPAADRKSPPAERVNLNTAGIEELTTLPGIGETIARRIVAYRELHGRFQRPEDLVAVNGIGPKTFDRLRDWVTAD